MVVRDSLYCSLVRHSAMKVDFYVVFLSLFYSLCLSQSWFNVFPEDSDSSFHFLGHLIFFSVITITFEI